MNDKFRTVLSFVVKSAKKKFREGLVATWSEAMISAWSAYKLLKTGVVEITYDKKPGKNGAIERVTRLATLNFTLVSKKGFLDEDYISKPRVQKGEPQTSVLYYDLTPDESKEKGVKGFKRFMIDNIVSVKII